MNGRVEWSKEEMTELALLRIGGFSLRRACFEFHRKHRDRPQPSTTFCANLVERLRKYGRVDPRKPPGSPKTATTKSHALRLMHLLALNPSASIRICSEELGISVGSVSCLLKQLRKKNKGDPCFMNTLLSTKYQKRTEHDVLPTGVNNRIVLKAEPIEQPEITMKRTSNKKTIRNKQTGEIAFGFTDEYCVLRGGHRRKFSDAYIKRLHAVADEHPEYSLKRLKSEMDSIYPYLPVSVSALVRFLDGRERPRKRKAIRSAHTKVVDLEENRTPSTSSGSDNQEYPELDRKNSVLRESNDCDALRCRS